MKGWPILHNNKKAGGHQVPTRERKKEAEDPYTQAQVILYTDWTNPNYCSPPGLRRFWKSHSYVLIDAVI